MWEIQSASQWSRCWRIHLGTHLSSLGTQFPSPLITHIGQGFIGPIWLWKWHMDQLNFLGFQDLNSTFLLVLVLKVGSCLANVHSYGPTLCLEPVLAIGWVLWLKVCYKTWENSAFDKFTSNSVLFYYFSSTGMHAHMQNLKEESRTERALTYQNRMSRKLETRNASHNTHIHSLEYSRTGKILKQRD